MGVPADAVALAVNVTATEAEAAGALTVYSAEGAVPETALVHFRPGQTRANWGFVLLGPGPSFIVSNGSTGATHAIVDVNGYFK